MTQQGPFIGNLLHWGFISGQNDMRSFTSFEFKASGLGAAHPMATGSIELDWLETAYMQESTSSNHL